MHTFTPKPSLTRLACKLLASALLAISISTAAKAQENTTAPAAPAAGPTAAPAPKPALPAAGAGLPRLKFAQITDAHLFDAGYKCSGEYVEREYQENLNAVRWALEEIVRRSNSGDKVDFVVFTGDLGIANLAGGIAGPSKPDPSMGCSDASDADNKKTWGPIAPMDFAAAEAVMAKLIQCLPAGLPVYFLPGNNDLGSAASPDEDPDTLWRYDQFVSGLKVLTHGQVVDLNNQKADARGYTLVGLNSSGFKPQKPAGGTPEAPLAKPGAVTGKSGKNYCDEIDDNAATGTWAAKKAEAIQKLASFTAGEGAFLVFTHEPDLQDPHRVLNDQTGCEFRSTWLLPKKAREQWTKQVLDNPRVLGIFAGHFHDPDSAKYGGPQVNDAAAQAGAGDGKPWPVTRTGGFAPIFVTPPLAVKLQWKDYPSGSRGMSFVTVNKSQIDEQVVRYWPQSAMAQTGIGSGQDGSDCCGDQGNRIAHWLQAAFQKHPWLAFVDAFFLTLILVIIILGLASSINPVDATAEQIAADRKRHWTLKLAQWPRRFLTRTWSLATSLLIEGDTKSYSLSKMQFLLWTMTTIYSYTYLWVAHTWVQGLPGIPDIQNDFPWQVFISAGTTVASQLSNRVAGSKGGGPLAPQLSDLISAGGVMAPGRLQFFSWTLVGITAYLSSVLATDPSFVHGLPSIPPELLAVSGISSVAYLGTRAVSAPGPVLNSAAFEPGSAGPTNPMAPAPATPPDPNNPATGAPDDPANGGGDGNPAAPAAAAVVPVASSPGKLILVGRYLSKNAALTLTPLDNATPANSPADSAALPANAAFTYEAPPQSPADKDAEPGNPGFYTRLTLQVTGVQPGKTYTLRLTNPDGKYAEIALAVTPQQSAK